MGFLNADSKDFSRIVRYTRRKIAKTYDLIHCFRLRLDKEKLQPYTSSLLIGKFNI
jgi:hypothetical protein